MNSCPQCTRKGRAIPAATFLAQVKEQFRGEPADSDGWRMCLSSECDTIYFRGSREIQRSEVRAVPFHKSVDPGRLVCFCFEHSVADVIADAQAHGVPTIRDSIRAACKAGRDNCERKNPQGRCCLGNVGLVLKSAPAPPTDGGDGDCCAADGASSSHHQSGDAPDDAGRVGLIASSGAVVVALLASACCWLPLVALGLGASVAGVGAFFEAWRVPLLIAATCLVVGAFYLSYRTPRCGPDGTCVEPDPRVRRLNRGVLWMTVVATVGFAFFPQYVGAFIGGQSEPEEVTPEQTLVRYHIAGMTCGGCEEHVRNAIEEIPGVLWANVSHSEGVAEVAWEGEPDHEAVVAVVAGLGYEASR